MDIEKKSVLLVSMPFTGLIIPDIRLPLLEKYLKERDIKVQTRHLYLKAAEFYGIPFYNCQNRQNQKQLSFEEYVQRTDILYKWVLEHVDWKAYDIIGFMVNPEQFLPSLAIAKQIKEQYPEKIIIFTGSQTSGQLGVNVLRAIDCIDFVISGDCEEAFSRLASDYQNYDSIPHLIYRVENEVIWNQPDTYINLNKLPIPDFDSFYKELSQVSKEVRQFFLDKGRLPVEISRGCCWSQCTFCNINIQYPYYREKSVKRIIEEIKSLSDEYTIPRFQLIGNTPSKKDSRLLFEKIIQLGRDLDFCADVRPGQLQSGDYRFMKKAGFNNIHLRVFSFNQNFLKKMNTGVRVIDNIASLKYCKENGIHASYDLLVNYPFEEDVDVDETKKTLDKINALDLDIPQQLTNFVVHFGSVIYNNPTAFNIDKLDFTDNDKLMFPLSILEKNISFYYNFKRKKDIGKHDWEQLIREWRAKKGKLYASVDMNITNTA